MTYNKTHTLLKLENISMKFGDNLVLRDINFDIKDIIGLTTTGQVMTIIGPSGGGKSTLFKIIAGLLAPTTGTVLIGKEQKPVCTGEVGMVLQNYPLLEHRTLESNLLLVNTDKDKVGQYLVEFDIWEHRDKYPKNLSGGQRQRAALAQQILSSKHFTLLDEPFSGLDPKATSKLCHILTDVANMDDENTIILSSHILEPALAISDSYIVIGRESTEPDIYIPGSTIIRSEDLAQQGLAWDPGIRKNPLFIQKVEEIRQLFKTI